MEPRLRRREDRRNRSVVREPRDASRPSPRVDGERHGAGGQRSARRRTVYALRGRCRHRRDGGRVAHQPPAERLFHLPARRGLRIRPDSHRLWGSPGLHGRRAAGAGRWTALSGSSGPPGGSRPCWRSWRGLAVLRRCWCCSGGPRALRRACEHPSVRHPPEAQLLGWRANARVSSSTVSGSFRRSP